MFDKLLEFLTRYFIGPLEVSQDSELPTPTGGKRSCVINPMDTNLMTQIDAKRIDNIEKVLALVALHIKRLVEEETKTQEYLVHLSTLHEELLNQLDQGNIAMIKVQHNKGNDPDQAELDNLFGGPKPEPANKKKSNLN